MIITTNFEVEPGRIYTEKDFDGRPFEYIGEKHYKYRFYVLRKTTEEEFNEYIKTHHPDRDIISLGYHCEISMD